MNELIVEDLDLYGTLYGRMSHFAIISKIRISTVCGNWATGLLIIEEIIISKAELSTTLTGLKIKSSCGLSMEGCVLYGNSLQFDQFGFTGSMAISAIKLTDNTEVIPKRKPTLMSNYIIRE